MFFFQSGCEHLTPVLRERLLCQQMCHVFLTTWGFFVSFANIACDLPSKRRSGLSANTWVAWLRSSWELTPKVGNYRAVISILRWDVVHHVDIYCFEFYNLTCSLCVVDLAVLHWTSMSTEDRAVHRDSRAEELRSIPTGPLSTEKGGRVDTGP